MPISLGTTTITALFLGTTSISSAYLGNTQVFGGSFTPLSLFSTGAQGIWLDPSDLSTMFSDRAGTTPVTTPGTVVGLRLDKSKGLVLGSELVVNGDFSNGLTGWIAVSGITAVDNAANLSAVAVGSSSFYRPLAFAPVAGKVYQVSFTISNYASGAVSFRIDGQNKTSRSSNGTFTQLHVGVAASSNVGIAIESTATLTIDNISVRELAGQHATQSITAALAAYRSGPARVDYDAVDDFHRVVFPAMSNATIAYSSPSVGATILTGQTIAAGNFDWNTDDCGLIIIDRPLTTAETIEVTAYLNAKAV